MQVWTPPEQQSQPEPELLPRAPSPDFNRHSNLFEITAVQPHEEFTHESSGEESEESFCSCPVTATQEERNCEPTDNSQPRTSVENTTESEFHCSSGERESSLQKRKETFLQNARR